jgi:thymidylate synthase
MFLRVEQPDSGKVASQLETENRNATYGHACSNRCPPPEPFALPHHRRWNHKHRYRLLEDEQGVQWLNCNIRFRSNDAWGASFMNMFGFILFNRDVIAAAVAHRAGKTVKLGRLNRQADSYHIYGKDIADAKARLFDRLATTTLADRSYRLDDEMIRDMYNEAEPAIRAKIAEYDRTH